MSNLYPKPNIPVLDSGYVQLIQYWGSDELIIESARVSVNGGFKSWEPYEGHPNGDMGLLRYLLTQKPIHSSPFEQVGATFEIQAPIAVFREWHRHRTQSYSEISGRYSVIPNNNYMPTPERLLRKDSKNKQASSLEGSEELTAEEASRWLEELEECYSKCEETYQLGLRKGVPKEIARLCMPVGRYSRMRASANLVNWLRFLSLRNHPKAQEEIRLYAIVVESELTRLFPRTMGILAAEKSK